MKHTNIAKRALACGLAVAMVVTGGNYSTVNVSAKKKAKATKTKAKLSKKKVSVTAGGTVTLKVKKANKKVKWSTKNKKVVKITKTSGKKKETATILGVKKGSTVVVAKIGKTKLKCKVTVKANNIQSVSVDKLDYSALTVKFSKKTPLNAGDVKVAIKSYKSGSYNENPKVEALSTTDQKTYRLYLTQSAGLNDYVRITVGKFTKEIQNKQAFGVKKDTVTWILEKDAVLVGKMDTYFYQPVGYISYSLKKGSKLPKGLSLVGKRGVLKGIPTEAGVTETTLTGQDEAGRKANLKVIFKVYDETTIAAADSTDNEIILDDYMNALSASRLATAAPATPEPVQTVSPDYGYDYDYPSSTDSASTPAKPQTAKKAQAVPAVATAAPAVATKIPAVPATAIAALPPTVLPSVATAKPAAPSAPKTAAPASAVKTSAPSTTVNPEVTPDPNTVYTSYDIEPVGGSGSYKYDLVQTGTDAGVKLSTDVTDSNNQVTKKAAAKTTLYIPYGLTAGVHTYTINITDAADAARTTTSTVSVNVVERFNISGTVKDAMENAVSGNESIYFYPADAVNYSDYIHGRTFLKYVEKQGTYSSRKELVAGNHPKDYKVTYGSDTYRNFECANGDIYDVYNLDETTKAGPFPAPTILREAPTQAPAASPQSTGFSLPVIEAGNYAAEVPAGKYVVKLLGNNGVKYQLNGEIDITADAVAAVNLTMPVRFANIKAVAKFANDKAVANDRVYFETENKQYESWTMYADTDYQGSFSASLPAGTYKIYWRDENGQRQYFTNSITVQDGTNAELGDQKLAVSRYEVTGSLKIHQYGDDGKTEVDQLAGNKRLLFFDAKGNVKSVYTDYDSHYDVQSDKYVDGANHGTFRGLLLDNGEYTVRYNGAYGLVTLGKVTVNGADARADLVYNKLDGGMANQFALSAPTMLTLEQESVLQSSGNNDLFVKFAIPEAADQGYTSYDISAKFNENQALPNSVTLYKETGDAANPYEEVRSFGSNNYYDDDEDADDSSSSTKMTVSLQAGNYVMCLTPISEDQKIGSVTVKVAKHLAAYEKSSTALTLDGAVASVVCAKNVADEDLQNVAYVKVSVEQGKQYEVSYSSKTVGTNDLSVSMMSWEKVTGYHVSSKNNNNFYYDEDGNYVSSTNSAFADGCGKVVFKAAQSGDVYLKFATSSTLYATIDVSAVVK